MGTLSLAIAKLNPAKQNEPDETGFMIAHKSEACCNGKF